MARRLGEEVAVPLAGENGEDTAGFVLFFSMKGGARLSAGKIFSLSRSEEC